jgi:PPOX class probable F420-dependent enzyme
VSQDKALLSDAARRFVAAQRVAHLATADAAGVPHVVPICFALVDQAIYVAIDEKPKRSHDPSRLRRLQNIAANPTVSVVFDVYDDRDWGQLGFVLLQCQARSVSADDAEHALALGALRAKYAQYRTMALEDRPVIALAIERVTSWGKLG